MEQSQFPENALWIQWWDNHETKWGKGGKSIVMCHMWLIKEIKGVIALDNCQYNKPLNFN